MGGSGVAQRGSGGEAKSLGTAGRSRRSNASQTSFEKGYRMNGASTIAAGAPYWSRDHGTRGQVTANVVMSTMTNTPSASAS